MRDVFLSMDYFVVDIDLKGETQNVQNVLEKIAKRIAQFFGTLEYNQSACMPELILRCPSKSPTTIFQTVPLFVETWMAWEKNFLALSFSAFWTGLISVVVALFSILVAIRDKVVEMVKLATQKWRLILGCAIILVLIMFFNKRFLFFNSTIAELSQWAFPLAEQIKNADWKLLVCSLNALTQCVPRSHPILMIREFSALENNSRTLFLKALENMKQGNVEFPVYIETSDFLWVADEPIIKSSDSFESYYLSPMTYDEGFTDLVERYNIWTEEEYQTVYEAVGGHLGSLNTLFQKNKRQHFKLQVAIEQMDSSAMRQLIASLDVTSNRSEAKIFLTQLSHSSNFVVEVETTSSVINTLLDRNILFRRDIKVFPQNRLMERAIASYVMKFCKDRPSLTL